MLLTEQPGDDCAGRGGHQNRRPHYEGRKCGVQGLICTVESLHDHKRVEEAMRNSRSRRSSQVVWAINLKGIYVLPSGILSRSSDTTSVTSRCSQLIN